MDRVALRAQLLIVGRLEVEAAVEIERRAIFVELGANPGAVREDEVDLLDPDSERARMAADRDAFGALLLDPFDLRERSGAAGPGSQDHFVLDDQPSDRLRTAPGCAAKMPSSSGTGSELSPSHLVARHRWQRLRSKALNDQ